MIEYFLLILVLPFLDLSLIPFVFAFLVIKAEQKGIDYSKLEALLYVILPLFPSIVSGFEKYFFFMAYFMSIMLSVKIASKAKEEDKIKELIMVFGEKRAKEILFIVFFLNILKEKFRRLYITSYVRGKINPIKLITNISIYINEKAKRIAVTKALRES